MKIHREKFVRRNSSQSLIEFFRKLRQDCNIKSKKKTLIIYIKSDDTKYYVTCFENVNLFENDDVKFELNRFSTNKVNDFDEYN